MLTGQALEQDPVTEVTMQGVQISSHIIFSSTYPEAAGSEGPAANR